MFSLIIKYDELETNLENKQVKEKRKEKLFKIKRKNKLRIKQHLNERQKYSFKPKVNYQISHSNHLKMNLSIVQNLFHLKCFKSLQLHHSLIFRIISFDFIFFKENWFTCKQRISNIVL